MKETEVIINDDYAILTSANYYFYYGYEFNIKELDDDDEYIWGFEVTKNNKSVYRISADEMEKYKNCPNQWQCEKMLLFGIGMYLSDKG